MVPDIATAKTTWVDQWAAASLIKARAASIRPDRGTYILWNPREAVALTPDGSMTAVNANRRRHAKHRFELMRARSTIVCQSLPWTAALIRVLMSGCDDSQSCGASFLTRAQRLRCSSSSRSALRSTSNCS